MPTRTAARTRTATVPARWRLAPPSQARSRETVDRFAEAAETLLESRPFEEITVQDIVRRAGRPIGSFYARFASKEALLPYLYQRYHDGLDEFFRTRLARVRWEALELEAAVGSFVDLIIAIYLEKMWLLRALALFARMRPEALPEDLVERRRKVYDHAVAALLPDPARPGARARIRHADPESAIRFGVFVVSSVVREKLLFADAPLSRVTPIGRRALRTELVRVLHSYLTSGAPS